MDGIVKRFDYNDFIIAVDDLALKLKDKNFDAILFAARGGAFLAASLAYKLNIRTMYAINCSNYSGTTKLATTKLQTLPQIEQNHTNLLFVDEIIDSGETLNAILDEILIFTRPHYFKDQQPK
jgi:hypoxanthine phosphoribosyltransferase